MLGLKISILKGKIIKLYPKNGYSKKQPKIFKSSMPVFYFKYQHCIIFAYQTYC